MNKTIPVTDSMILSRDIFWMLLFAAVLLPMIFIPKRFQFNKLEGVILVGGYGLFIALVFLGS
jgi:cation:H+ antiporter